MAYKKRSYRKHYGKRKLSNYNIAMKTSAKAQSRQIYALKKRINYVYRLTKPEIQIQQRVATDITLTALAQAVMGFPLVGTSTSNAIIYPSVLDANTASQNNAASGDTAAIGPNRFARARSIVFYGNWQYGTVAEANTPLTLRIVIIQTKTTRDQLIGADDVFTAGNSGSNYFAAVYGPLQSGLARTCKVLSDKRYQLNYQRPNVSIQTRLRYLSNFYRDRSTNQAGDSSSDYIPKGAIQVLYALYSPAATLSSSTLSFMYKLAYTDS